MKITILVGGKFNAFMLARILENLGCLEKIITTYPKFKLRNEKIPASKIKPIILPSQVLKALFEIDLPVRIKEYEAGYFGFVSTLFLNNNSDAVYGFAGYSLEGAKKIKKRNGLFILDRACPHVEYQEQLSREDADKLQIKYASHTGEWIKRCLKEYQIADKIIVPSDFTLNSFVERGVPPDKLYKIPLIGKSKFLSSEEINKRKKQDNVFRVCAIGALFRKGTIYLLEAWNKLKLKNAELLLRGSEKELLKSPVIAKELKKSDNIRILPYFNDINDFYLLGDVFCFPSTDDGFGMALMEAMACRLPVITTGNAGASEYVKDGEQGFVVPVRNPEAIAQKIEYFYSNRKKAEECGEMAYSRVKKEFEENVYERAVANFLNKAQKDIISGNN